MKNYFKYIFICFLAIFSFYYTSKVMKLSTYNDSILVSINDYAKSNDSLCDEGKITSNGIILGINGLIVNKSKSYSNMKGIGFKKELIEYDESKCILNKQNNLDRYILGANEHKNAVSIIIDIDTGKYYKEMLKIADSKNIELNILSNYKFLKENIESIENHSTILFKGKSKEELKDFISILHDEIFCVKTDDYEVLDICSKKKINSILMQKKINKN